MWGTFLSEPLRIVALVGRCPANKLMRRMPIPDRRIFHLEGMHPPGIWGIRPSFPGLSPCPGQVAYVLLTSAPVAARVLLPRAAPRLACVKPVASVHPEPGSNSSLLYYRFFFFKNINENATACCLCPGPALTPDAPCGRHGAVSLDVLCSYSYLSVGILTWTREVPFLVSALSIFLIANISMNSSSPAPRPFS